MSGRVVLMGAALGAAAMYLLDPAHGLRRRATVRDATLHRTRRIGRAVRTVGVDALSRALGAGAELRARATEDAVDDGVLVERVRAGMGHAVRHPHGVEVSARDGTVTLAGAAAPHEIERLVRSARAVRGVRHVVNDMRGAEVDTPAHHPV